MKYKELKDTVINVKTQKEYNEFMDICNNIGIDPLPNDGYWIDYKNNTCVIIEKDFSNSYYMCYANVNYFTHEESKKIISLNEFKKSQGIKTKRKLEFREDINNKNKQYTVDYWNKHKNKIGKINKAVCYYWLDDKYRLISRISIVGEVGTIVLNELNLKNDNVIMCLRDILEECGLRNIKTLPRLYLDMKRIPNYSQHGRKVNWILTKKELIIKL